MAPKDLCSPAFWERAWKRCYEMSPLRRGMHQNKKVWFQFWNEVSDIYLQVVKYSLPLGETVAELLSSLGILRGGAKVLDVGSGPGTLALPLAARGAQVVALDPAFKMLQVLRAAGRWHGLGNIFPVCQSFADCHFRDRFDLVVASFSPAIVDGPTLRRLEGFSKGWCALLVAADLKGFSMRDLLWEPVMQQPLPTFRYPALLPFNLLFTLERRPNIRQLSFRTNSPPPETLGKFYSRYFSLFGKDQAETERLIISLLQTSQGGRSSEGQTHNIALIWWQSISSEEERGQKI